MKKTLTRILSLILALITVCGLMIAPASAASVSDGITLGIINVDTSGGKFVVVKTDNAKLRTKAAFYGSTYATVTKGSLLQINGSSGDYYKVKMGGVNYYIHKNDVKSAGASYKASIDYTTVNAAAFRTGPAQKCSIAYKPAKGTAFLTVGTLRNSSNNLWVIVYNPSNRSLSYLYSGNCSCCCINLGLSVVGSNDTVPTLGTIQLQTLRTHKAVTNGVIWTSSNPNVATVDCYGTVYGWNAGTANITATLDGLGGAISVSVPINVTPQVYLDVPLLRQYNAAWKNKYIAQSCATIGSYGCTLTSVTMLYSYQTRTSYTPDVVDDMLRFTSGGAVYWDSVTKLTGYQRYYSFDLYTIYNQLKQGKPVIIGGKAYNGNTHWVIITGYNGDGVNLYASNFLINDPGNSNRTNLQHFFNSFPRSHSILY